MRWLVLFCVLIFLVSCTKGPGYTEEDIDDFAKCITRRGAVMYGVYYSPQSAKLKEQLGPSFDHINYVECDWRGPDEQSDLCQNKNIEDYDTWEFADGSKIVSPTLEELSEKTGCEMPG